MDNAQALLARKNRPAAALYTDYREMLRREKLDAVIRRFMEQGRSAEETAVRMDIPVDFVTDCLNKEQ